MKREEKLFRASIHFEQTRNFQVKNKKMDEFIRELQRVAKENETDYEENPCFLPMNLPSRSTLVFFEKDEPERDSVGMEHCDVLIYNPEEYTYTKVKAVHGIKELFAEDGVCVSNFLIDGFMATQLRYESAILVIDRSCGLFLRLLPVGHKEAEGFTLEEIEECIEKNPIIKLVYGSEDN